ncbi:hypothetical protein JX266_003998 [Neoarthrinium moseri]|nr:hypothetical protein JX266_003998 [Neoarthrinium moseri]
MDIARGMPWHSAPLGILTLSYYLLFGNLGDAYLLCFWTLLFRWQRGTTLIPIYDGHSLGVNGLLWALTVAVASYVLIKAWTRSGRHVKLRQWSGPTKPLLFPCRTTHTRLFPKKHSFTYSYLMVGVPVGWEGSAGGMISTASRDVASTGWYQIHAADYLERGNGHLGLRGKLDDYLKSQGADPSCYPYAYLVTAAKFLGYHFNPISFWYLYSAERDMTAMVLEVNNTFGERRMYFLTSSDAAERIIKGPSVPDTGGLEDKTRRGPASSTLRQAWPKDFHVSPFNSRKGGYSLVARDPFAPMLEGVGRINNTINMSSSKSHPKLTARIFSEGDAIDPLSMGMWQKLKFLTAWWWVGFVTFPRIVKEAGVLFFKRKLHVWYRPEPLRQSMGRLADETERQLEPMFRRYLEYLVSQCPTPLAIRYIPSGLADSQIETFTSPAAHNDNSVDELDFKVLTPVFYSRFVYYAHDLEALFCELNESCTIWVSRPDLIPKLVFKKPPPTLRLSSYFDYGYFKLIQKMRRRPERIVRPMTSTQVPTEFSTPNTKKTDIRDFRISSMDGYVLSNEEEDCRKLYRSLVLKLFIADQVAMGSMDLLWLESFIFRTVLAWIATR